MGAGMRKLALGLVAAIAASASAQTPTTAKGSAMPEEVIRNPDQKVCEDITVIGSRLAVKRVCATRAQWAEKRRRDRELTDQAQRSPCVVAQMDGGKQIC